MDDAHILLNRHHARRVQGVATVGVLAGPTGLSSHAWRDWAGERPTLSAASPAELVLAYWWQLDCAEGRELAVRRVGGKAGEGERLNWMTSRDFAVWWDGLPAAHDPAPAVTVARRLLANQSPAANAVFPGEACPGSALLAAVAQLLGQRARCAVLVPEPGGDRLRTAFEFLTRVAERTPELPVAVLTPSADELLACEGDTRLGSLAREGLVRVRGLTAEEIARVAGPGVPGELARKLAEAGASRRTAESLAELAARPTPPEDAAAEDAARSSAERLLYGLLADDAHTAGMFELNQKLAFFHGRKRAEADLLCRELSLAIELDGAYFHLRDPESYRRDRAKDLLYQAHGITVLRFLSEDVMPRMEFVLSTIRDAVRARKGG